MARRADLPVTGPQGDAMSRQRRAQDALDDRNSQKRAAALRDPNVDTFAQTARRVKQSNGGAWITGHRDELAGTKRNGG